MTCAACANARPSEIPGFLNCRHLRDWQHLSAVLAECQFSPPRFVRR